MKKNILFETFDIEVKIKDENPELSAFLKGAKEMVRDKIATPPSQSKSLVPVGNTEKATETTKPSGNNNKFGYNHKRKGKRKGKRHTTTTHPTNTTCSETQISLFGDDLSDPCGTIL
jgi:hypothetical protein